MQPVILVRLNQIDAREGIYMEVFRHLYLSVIRNIRSNVRGAVYGFY
jgi:hypothetical protein